MLRNSTSSTGSGTPPQYPAPNPLPPSRATFTPALPPARRDTAKFVPSSDADLPPLSISVNPPPPPEDERRGNYGGGGGGSSGGIGAAPDADFKGFAAVAFPDGTVYEGEWECGAPHGEGSCVFGGSRNIYVGAWSRGRCEGRGTLIYADSGEFYSGNWSRGACDGSGVFVGGGNVIVGTWAQGALLPGSQVGPLLMSPGKSGAAIGANRQGSAPTGTSATAAAAGGGVGRGSRAQLAKIQAFNAVAAALSASLKLESTGVLHRRQPSSPLTDAATAAAGRLGAGPNMYSIGGTSSNPATPQQQSLSLHASVREPLSGGGELPHFALAPPPGSSTNLGGSFAFGSMSIDGGFAGNRLSDAAKPKEGRRARSSTVLGSGRGSASAAGSIATGGDATEMTVAPVGSSIAVPVGPSATQAVAATEPINTAAAGTAAALREVLFAAAGPAYNSSFDLPRYAKFLVIFLFPYLSLPHIKLCPCPISFLEIEREYVVSGAALRIDFEPPSTALYLSALAVASTWLTLGFSNPESLHFYNRVTYTDVIAPIVLMTLFAAMNAGYHSFRRVAHALERFDRHFYPKMAAFASNAVDSASSVCIYTWDEDGNSRVTNAHYRYRWVALSAATAALVGFCVPVLRVATGKPAYGETSLDKASLAFSSIALFTGAMGITYYVLKITDMQRQVLSQMSTLSKLAFINGFSVVRPTYIPSVKFDLDAPVDPRNLFEGFVGWYVTRCFVMYSSVCANHSARAASMSAFAALIVAVYLVAIIDAIVASINGNITPQANYFSAAHILGLIVVIVWGSLLTRFIYFCSMTDREQRTHLYLADVASLYHQSVMNNSHAAGVLSLCRSMIAMHDHRPELLGIKVRRGTLALAIALQLGALVALLFQLVQLAR